MGAGAYPTRLEWSRRVRKEPDSFGEKREEWEVQAMLWGAVGDETAFRVTEKETTVQRVSATVRVRNYPPLLPGDRLADAGRGVEWFVVVATRGDNETSADCQR